MSLTFIQSLKRTTPRYTLLIMIVCWAFAGISTASAQDKKLIAYEKARSKTKAEMEAKWKEEKIPQIVAPVNYGVDIYEIDYWTEWHDGTPIKASGMYFLPQGKTTDLPLMTYHHGTIIIKKRRGLDYNGESAICLAFAVDGYAVAWPDYVGLGRGEKFHLYQNVESEAQASIDLMRAIRELNIELGVELNDELYLTGYSQGGHASLSTHKIIQEKYSSEFTVTASSPMSGAYDMAGVQVHTMFEEYTQPHYLPYLIHGMNEVYDIWDGDLNEIYAPPYDSIIPSLFDDNHSVGQINDALPKIPKDMIKDEVVQDFVDDLNHPFRKALEANGLTNWKPETPVQFCYCTNDEEVFYKNALVAHERMKAAGAKNVTLRRTAKKFGHFQCASFAAIHTKMYFDSFRKGKRKGKKGPVFKRFLITLAKTFTKADEVQP